MFFKLILSFISSNNLSNVISFKGTRIRVENLPISSSSYKKNTLKISHYNIIYFLRHALVRYVKSLITDIQKQ